MSLHHNSLLRWHRSGVRRDAITSSGAVRVRPWRLGRVVLFLALTVAWPSSNLARAACSNGLEGFEAEGVCCHVNCGFCGGDGCSTIPDTLGDDDCCIQDIISSDILCSEQDAAPCIIDNAISPAPSAANASQTPASPEAPTATPTPAAQNNTTSPPAPVAPTGAPVEDGIAPNSPSASSPPSYSPTAQPSTLTARPVMPTTQPAAATTKPAAATAQPVSPTAQPSAAATAEPVTPTAQPVAPTAQPEAATAQPAGSAPTPMVVQATTEPAAAVTVAPTFAPNPPFAESTCSNGLAGVQKDEVCCMERCGQCGGEGCGLLGAAHCCYDQIKDSGVICGEEGAIAPCIIAETPAPVPLAPGVTPAPFTPTTAPTAAPARAPTAEPSAPVTSPSPTPMEPGAPTAAPMSESRGITGAPVSAGEGETAPSPVNNPTTTSAPVPAEEQLCSDDIPGYKHGVACCPLECGQCGGSGCDNINGAIGSGCCSDKVLRDGALCNSTAGVLAPCVLGTVDEVEVGTGVSDAASGVASLSSAVAVGVACAAAVAATACFASSHMALNGLL